MNQKTAIYVRVSTHYQVDKDSLQVQKRELIAYTQLVLNIRDYEIFEDAGFSAKNTERPEYQKMISRIKEGEFSHLLVWKIDRISRNLLDFSEMYSQLKKCGVIFVSKNEQFDTSSAIGEAMLKIILVFAELERKMTAERVTAVMLSRANVGKWNGGRIPYGYVRKGEVFELDPVEAPVAEKIFDLYASSHSILTVVDYLNSHGITTREKNLWTTTSVHKILKNVFYIGEYRYNVHADGKGIAKKDESEWIVIPDHHQPLIHRSRFEYVQKTLTQNQRGSVLTGKTYQRKLTHIFAGILRCAECGNSLSASADRRRANGWQPSMYSCYGRRKRTCPSKYVSEVTLLPQVFQYLANMIQLQESYTPDMTISQANAILLQGDSLKHLSSIGSDGVKNTLKNLSSTEYIPLWQAPDSEPTENTIALKNRLRKLTTALDRLNTLYLYADNPMSETEYTLERAKIQNEAQTLEKKISELESQSFEGAPSQEDFVTRASAFLMIDLLSHFDEKSFMDFIISADRQVCKTVVNSCISSIMISNGNIVSITFKNGITHIWEHRKSSPV